MKTKTKTAALPARSKTVFPRLPGQLIPVLICVLGLAFCGREEDNVEKIIENGVEVTVNHLEPYNLKGEPQTLTLERLLSIDTGDDAVAAAGIRDIYRFDVDAEGGIFILSPPVGKGNLIFRFSSEGHFLASFGLMGQGPNEMEYPDDILTFGTDQVWITESPKKKIHLFKKDGSAIAEKTLDPGFVSLVPLENGTYLVSRLIAENMQAKYFPIVLSLYDSDFKPVKELDRFSAYPNRIIADTLQEKTICGTEFAFVGKAGGGRVYAGNSERGYEVWVFDLGGRLLRKVRKGYTPVPVSEEYKKEYVKPYEEMMPEYAKKIYFPQHWHPFHSFFADDGGRLFVMTFEPGENPGEHMFDVFNKDGILITRKSLNILHGGSGTLLARARGDRLYVLQEKPSGFKELVVYQMIWS
jgi:hypothetical protein